MKQVIFALGVVLANAYFAIFEFRKEQGSRAIVLAKVGPLSGLKAAATLVPLYLMLYPTDLVAAGPLMLDATALTVIAAPLVLPFWEVPEWAAASGLTRFAALWVPINLAKLASAYLITKLIGFASEHFELFAHILEAANKLNFQFYGDLFPQSPKVPVEEELKSLLLLGFYARILLIFRSGRHLLGLLATLLGPIVLTYAAQVYGQGHLPPHSYEFTPAKGVLMGLLFVLATEYTLASQARAAMGPDPD